GERHETEKDANSPAHGPLLIYAPASHYVPASFKPAFSGPAFQGLRRQARARDWVRGSSASRSASPTRLTPSTTTMMANPGKTDVHTPAERTPRRRAG